MEETGVTDRPFRDIPTGERPDQWDRDRSVPLDVASIIVRRSRTTLWKWRSAGLPTEQLGGVTHVNVGDLLDWGAQHGRRRGRATDYF